MSTEAESNPSPQSEGGSRFILVADSITINAVDGPGIQLSVSHGGDLLVKALSGPNQGKTVDLTYGRWQDN
jgi:hypothetical protein